MVMLGLDYSWARPGGAAIREAGFEFVVRYVPYLGDGGKGLTAAELVDLQSNGLAVGLVFESTAERHMAGFNAGRVDALTTQVALGNLGWPDHLPVYFAVDFDAQPQHFGAIDDYQRGAASVLAMERIGVYGNYDVVDHCLKEGTATWLWQTYAWSRGRKHPERHLYQYLNGQELNGGAVDYNEAYGEAGLWLPEQEEDMSELEDLILSAWGAAGEESLPREERLTNARFRMGEAVGAGKKALAAQVAEHVAAHPGGGPDAPTHYHKLDMGWMATGEPIEFAEPTDVPGGVA